MKSSTSWISPAPRVREDARRAVMRPFRPSLLLGQEEGDQRLQLVIGQRGFGKDRHAGRGAAVVVVGRVADPAGEEGLGILGVVGLHLGQSAWRRGQAGADLVSDVLQAWVGSRDAAEIGLVAADAAGGVVDLLAARRRVGDRGLRL